MSVSLKGFNEKVITLQAVDGLKAGDAVSLSGNLEVSPASEGTDIFGFAISVTDGYAAVQVGGFITVPCEGIEDAYVGYRAIQGADEGKIALAESGRKVFVVSVDKAAGKIGIIL